MITVQHVTKAIAVALMLLMLPGCTTMELAVDLFKKQTREAVKDEVVVAAPRYKVCNPNKVAGISYYPERNLTSVA